MLSGNPSQAVVAPTGLRRLSWSFYPMSQFRCVNSLSSFNSRRNVTWTHRPIHRFCGGCGTFHVRVPPDDDDQGRTGRGRYLRFARNAHL